MPYINGTGEAPCHDALGDADRRQCLPWVPVVVIGNDTRLGDADWHQYLPWVLVVVIVDDPRVGDADRRLCLL